ncbi:formate dehydrogenase subunit gamma [Helicobacter apodemus]|uniref:Formate dehydrogenase subunit gamma n=1 Tax=Helicobacter apodemus TaxID=135569 RepID=A0A2U8FBQ9_9HELI|nr:formate dehydrogenase subunit gamma [Helicobacter apodemus]AWI33681.1 formate dehydrogenase subunit gamma [Helicobacter apodemus]
MKLFQSFFRVSVLFLALVGAVLAANTPNAESGKQYAETTQGNNSLMINPMNHKLYGGPEVESVKSWGIHSPNSIGWGEIFTLLQGHYFSTIFALVILFTILAFLGHYIVIGQKKFNHGRKIRVFSSYNIIVHWCAAIPFMIIALTGLIMVFGDKLGGGAFVRLARDIHGIATIAFVVFGILMFLMWVKNALPKAYDIQWLMMMGGYLSQEKRAIPAGKFNAGQKMWFWICTIGGFIMAISGAYMFFQFADIETLRIMALVHNALGFLIIAFLITHIYMAVFAIEGALNAIIDGHMGEEEIAILHSYYYKEINA